MNEEMPVETHRTGGGRVTRVRIRLKSPLPEDLEIHTVLPDSLEEFEEAFARGDLEALERTPRSAG